MSVMKIHRSVKQLGLNSYAKGKRHLLTNRMKEVFLNRCRKLLNWITANGSVSLISKGPNHDFVVESSFESRSIINFNSSNKIQLYYF